MISAHPLVITHPPHGVDTPYAKRRMRPTRAPPYTARQVRAPPAPGAGRTPRVLFEKEITLRDPLVRPPASLAGPRKDRFSGEDPHGSGFDSHADLHPLPAPRRCRPAVRMPRCQRGDGGATPPVCSTQPQQHGKSTSRGHPMNALPLPLLPASSAQLKNARRRGQEQRGPFMPVTRGRPQQLRYRHAVQARNF